MYESGDSVSNYLSEGVLWHSGMFKWLNSSIRPGAVFVDIGAHIGLFSVFAAKKAGDTGKVIAFEPEPENFDMLRRNVSENMVNVDMRNVAIAETSGDMVLGFDSANRVKHSLIQASNLTAGPTVRARTLAEELAGLNRIDYLKLDIQGMEPHLLRHLSERIALLPRPPHILLEVNPTDWRVADPDFARLQAFKRDHRYDLHAFIASEGPASRPPVLRWSTFRALCDDIATYSGRVWEIDILLFRPKA